MLFKNIKMLDRDFSIVENAFVGVEGSKIEYIGTERPEKDYGRVYSGEGKLLMPGFYNCHGHSPMTLMRGYGENMALQEWLTKRIFPFEDKLTGEAVYWGTLLAMAESLRFGIVSTSDMYYFIDDMVRGVSDAGAKANISRAIVNFDDKDLWQLPSMKEMKRTFEAYNGYENGKIKMDVSIHGEYTSTEAAVREVSQYGKEVGAIMHIHVSETKQEHEQCKERRNGLTPVQYFARCGAFETPAVAAHCVHIEGDDYEILREKGVTVSVNPVSNLKLSSGICDVAKLFENNVKVAIGTDSVASNNNLNFFEEMKTLAIMSKVKANDPKVVTPVETLRAATLEGAMAQGRRDCGQIICGNRADLIVVDISKPNMVPVHNMANNLVYSASGSDVVLTMADGNVLYENGEYTSIDIEKTIFEADKCTKDILGRL